MPREGPGEERTQVDVIVLRKIGVLRTDSCSELLVMGGEYSLLQINSVFV